ncbi:hypothetical protein Zmor_013545 [Zophobas morio]|mgnify:FL=1|uniref:Uncharacterized protein n=1 Tax=Zophobas morio TaxID=2755281 RepID=A0AA38MF83_9CUCU|nr:hypothetical protein Zmor_013545 [Zophobas morio]
MFEIEGGNNIELLRALCNQMEETPEKPATSAGASPSGTAEETSTAAAASSPPVSLSSSPYPATATSTSAHQVRQTLPTTLRALATLAESAESDDSADEFLDDNSAEALLSAFKRKVRQVKANHVGRHKELVTRKKVSERKIKKLTKDIASLERQLVEEQARLRHIENEGKKLTEQSASVQD